MKKIIKLAFVFAGILLITGCSQQQTPPPVDNQPADNQPISSRSGEPNEEVISEKEASSQLEQAKVNEKPTFASDKQGNYYGVLTITGYPLIEKALEPFCEERCKTYEYVFFQILNTNSAAIFDFLGIDEGNSFVGDKKVGLGCKQNKILSYQNDSDKLGMKEYSLSPETSEKILSASKEKPVTIKLERLLYTSGRGAPACYSHFTYIDYLNM